MRTLLVIACIVLISSGLTGQVQQDTTKARRDTTNLGTLDSDSLRLRPAPPALAKPKAKYQIDTSFEAMNLERLYYGMDDRDGYYYQNPWEDYLFPDTDGREEDEGDQRDQERDSRE